MTQLPPDVHPDTAAQTAAAAPPPAEVVVNASPVDVAPVAVVAVDTGPSAFNHAALILGALILVAAAVFDSFHPLSPTDWVMIGAAVAALGVKGVVGIPA